MPRKARKRAHRQGTIHQRGPRNWAIRWREDGRRRYSGGYETRELAEQVRAKIVADLAAGRAGLPEPPQRRATLGTIVEEWLDRRVKTHRAAKDDRYRWTKHLRPFLASRQPDEVDRLQLRRIIEAKLAEGLNPSTVRLCMRLLSTLYTDLVEEGLASTNPVRSLPRKTRRLYRPTTDPRNTPFIEKLADVRRVFLELPEPINVAFAIGAFGGLRPGEVLGLEWPHIDLGTRRIVVRQQVHAGRIGPLKDDDSRVVPILESLAPVLAAWQLRSGGSGLVFPTTAKGGGSEGRGPKFMRPHTLHAHLKAAFKACELRAVNWYQATRHTFASQWVLEGKPIEKLSAILGHSTVIVTQRYAHLRPDLFPESDYGALRIDLARGSGGPVELPTRGKRSGTSGGTLGYSMGTEAGKRGVDISRSFCNNEILGR